MISGENRVQLGKIIKKNMAFLANSLLESRLLFVLKFPSVSFEIFIL